jgi:hypothetical protein
MSHESDKIKNSSRRFKDELAIKKQTKIAKQHHINVYDSRVEKEPHRFNKHHAMDCGNPDCYICGNPRKTHKDKLTQQEKSLFQDLDNVRDTHSNGLTPKDEE